MSTVKDKILDVASNLFYQNGYNLTGINQIVSESGVAIGSLYNHFPSKTDLLLAYLKRANAEYFTAMQAQVSKSNSPKEQLIAMFDFHSQFQQHTDYAGCNFIKINAEINKAETRVLELVKKHKNQLYDFVSDLVNKIDGLEAHQAKSTADLIYLLLEGAIVDSTIQKDLQFIQAAKEIIIARI